MRLSSKRIAMGVLLIGLFMLSMPVVKANLLDDILGPFQGIDFGATYAQYAMFIDGILYFLILFGLAKFVFKDKFGAGGNIMAIGMSLALSFAAAFFGSNNGFRLGILGPYAILIILIIAFLMFFNLLKNIGANGSLAFGIPFLLLSALFLNFLGKDLLDKNPWLKAAFFIALLVSVIAVIMGIVKAFKGNGSGDGGGVMSKLFGGNSNNPKAAEKNARKELENEQKALFNNQIQNQKTQQRIDELDNIDKLLRQDIQRTVGQEIQEYKEIMQELEKYVNVINQFIIPGAQRIEDLKAGKYGTGPEVIQQIQDMGDKLNRSIQYMQVGLENFINRLKELQEIIHKQQKDLKALRKDQKEEYRRTIDAVDGYMQLEKIPAFIQRMDNTIKRAFALKAKKALVDMGRFAAPYLGNKQISPEVQDKLKGIQSRRGTAIAQYNAAINALTSELQAKKGELVDLERKLSQDVKEVRAAIDTEYINLNEQENAIKEMASNGQKIIDLVNKKFSQPSSFKTLKEYIDNIVKKGNLLKNEIIATTQLEARVRTIEENKAKVEEMINELRKVIDEKVKKISTTITDEEHEIDEDIVSSD